MNENTGAVESSDGTVLKEVKGWTPIIDAVVRELGLIAAAVYGRVWRFCQMRTGSCTASLQRIGDEIGLSRKTVERHIKALCKSGFLKDLTPGRRNRPHVYQDRGRHIIADLLEASIGGTESPGESNWSGTESDWSVTESERSVTEPDRSDTTSYEDTIEDSREETDVYRNAQKRLRIAVVREVMLANTHSSPPGVDRWTFETERPLAEIDGSPPGVDQRGYARDRLIVARVWPETAETHAQERPTWFIDLWCDHIEDTPGIQDAGALLSTQIERCEPPTKSPYRVNRRLYDSLSGTGDDETDQLAWWVSERHLDYWEQDCEAWGLSKAEAEVETWKALRHRDRQMAALRESLGYG